MTDYEVLMEAGIWEDGSGGLVPFGAVVCGQDEFGEALFVARAILNGGLHPGKVRRGFGGAFIGFGGREVQVHSYQVLISPVR